VLAINGSAIDTYKPIAEAALKRNWEFMGHGYTQKNMQKVEDEALDIRKTTEAIEGFTGRKPRGWLGPGLTETWHTPDILQESGYEYVCDWVMEDIPVWMHTNNGPLLAMPYNLELNDSIVHAIEKHSSDEMLKRLMATVECFARETRAQSQVRILPIGLHPHLMGVPHRIGTLHSMVDYLRARPEVCFMNGSQIHDWFVAQQPA
jgi:peptidoglycan/xylan/chitin deacetylase (PgdA/CDA1 family)